MSLLLFFTHQELLDAVRITTCFMCLVVMILLPAALRVRRPTHGWGWLMVASIEIAWAENILRSVLRLGHPWSWTISPFLLASSVLAFVWILTIDRVSPKDTL